MVIKVLKKLFLVGVAFFCFSTTVNAQIKVENFSFDAYNELDLFNPVLKEKDKRKKIRIAIIDDGFNIEHELIKPFLNKNPTDIPNNYIDDDGNGFIDDSYGWNVADNNNDIIVTKGLERHSFHGTMIASIISTVFIKTYDTHASDFLEIIPIKAVSNSETTTYIKKGYEGIAYAIACDVDVICCAWSGGEITTAQKELLRQATAKGITIIGAAGNFFKKTLNPAANKNVVAVTAIDSNMVLIPTSNFGPEIDFVARGSEVRAGHPLDRQAYFYGNGTSAATALVAGSYGVVLSQFPNHTKKQLIDALKYTAKSVDQFNIKNVGRLGAGIPQVGKAIQYLKFPTKQAHKFNSFLSEGVLFFYPKDTIQKYSITPNGSFYGFEFQIESKAKKKKFNLEISTKDSTYNLNGADWPFSNKLLALGNTLSIKNITKRNKDQIRISYQVINIDSSKLYCSGTEYLYSPDSLEDGSGIFNYSNENDCKWIIRAPKGKRIRLTVTEINTQSNMDFLWIFEGEKLLTENLIAKFSGTNTPPVITSSSSEMILWFLTDKKTTGDGWKLKYEWVDK